MELNLKRWSTLPIFLAGRVNTMKMTVLPQFLCAFQMLPLFLLISFETESCSSSSPLPSLCTYFSKKSNYFSSNPVTKHSLRIWRQFRKRLNLTHTSGFLPLIHNDIFPAAQSDSASRSWYDSGIVFFKDLFVGNTFISFEFLRKDFTLPQVHFFR